MANLAERFHAVLIGIEAYGSPLYRPLHGAVADATAIAAYLRDDLLLPAESVRLMVAGPRATEADAASPLWPTAGNLVAAVRGLVQRTRRGDQVLIFFGGHGATAPTLVPGLRGPDGHDRGLVPVDIDAPGGGRLLRDVELSFLLGELAAAGLQVTVVLDCCHSGGSLRSAKPAAAQSVRGGVVDPRPPLPGLVAPVAELAAGFVQARDERNRLRPAAISSGWELPAAAVVAAACRAGEAAYEKLFDGRFRGLFTYWWLDGLRRQGLGRSYRALHRQVVARVQSSERTQTPMLEGDDDRLIFGEGIAAAARGIPVQHIDPATGRVVLGAGRVQGIGPGALLELELPDGRLSTLQVVEVDAVLASALLLDLELPLPEPGHLARLVDPGTAQWRAGVRFDPAVPAALAGELASAISASGFLAERPEGADFTVAVGPAGVFLGDGQGAVLLELGGAPAAAEVLGRLEHLTRYRNLHDLRNSDPRSRLAGLVRLSLRRPPQDWRHPQRIDPRLGEELPSGGTVGDGETVWLVIENRSGFAVSCAVFDLQPDWGCSRLVPAKKDSFELAGGRTEGFPLRWRHVDLGRPCMDRLKLLACIDATDFSWLELPLPKPQPKAGLRAVPGQVLQPLPSLGTVTWTTDEVDFEVLPPATESAS